MDLIEKRGKYAKVILSTTHSLEKGRRSPVRGAKQTRRGEDSPGLQTNEASNAKERKKGALGRG